MSESNTEPPRDDQREQSGATLPFTRVQLHEFLATIEREAKQIATLAKECRQGNIGPRHWIDLKVSAAVVDALSSHIHEYAHRINP